MILSLSKSNRSDGQFFSTYQWFINIYLLNFTPDRNINKFYFSQFSRSVVSNSATPCIATRQASLSINNSRSSLRLTSIKSVMPSSHLILCHPLFLLPPTLRASESYFQWVNSPREVVKVLEFQFQHQSFQRTPVSFRMDWLDLLAVQGTLKSLLQHHSSKASIPQCSAFFTVQLSHPYMTTGKTIALTRRTFVGKVMSLHLNMLSRLVIAFLPRCKQNTSCQMPGWMKHRLESRLPGEISITSDMQMTPPLWQKVKRN